MVIDELYPSIWCSTPEARAGYASPLGSAPEYDARIASRIIQLMIYSTEL
jgi:hypothetical protein